MQWLSRTASLCTIIAAGVIGISGCGAFRAPESAVSARRLLDEVEVTTPLMKAGEGVEELSNFIDFVMPAGEDSVSGVMVPASFQPVAEPAYRSGDWLIKRSWRAPDPLRAGKRCDVSLQEASDVRIESTKLSDRQKKMVEHGQVVAVRLVAICDV